MKKFFLILIGALLMVGCHYGHFGHCAEAAAPKAAASKAAKPLRVVASVFPIYLFAANVADKVPGINIDLLVPAAAGCPHDFALKPADLAKLAKADVLIINGGGLEDFLTKALDEMKQKPHIIDASEGIAFLKDESGKINPHVFASPHLATRMTQNIADHLGQLDKAHAEIFTKNAKAYEEKLEAVGAQLQSIGAKAKNKKIALEHDALAYIANDAGLTVVIELEHNTSAAQMAQLKKLLLEKKPALLAGDSQFPDKLLQTLALDTFLPYVSLDTCASGPAKAPLDFYEKTMEQNYKLMEHYFAK